MSGRHTAAAQMEPAPPSLPAESAARILAVTSGKGGVGKSNFSLNFALALQARGKRVLVFDADIGLANIDVLLGDHPPYNLYHLLNRERTMEEIIREHSSGVSFIAGGSGFRELLDLSPEELDSFAAQIETLSTRYDYILFDTGAGLSKETLKFILAAEETILVTTPEPTSLTDAYAILKMVAGMDRTVTYRLVVNRVSYPKEGQATADNFRMAAERFLSLDIPLLGFIPDDPYVSKAVRKQTPFLAAFPTCPASRSIRELADQMDAGAPKPQDRESGMARFVKKMVNLLRQ